MKRRVVVGGCLALLFTLTCDLAVSFAQTGLDGAPADRSIDRTTHGDVPAGDTTGTSESGGADATVGVEAGAEITGAEDDAVVATPTPTPDPGTIPAGAGGTFVGRQAARAHPGGEPEPCLEVELGFTNEDGDWVEWSFPKCIGGRLDCGSERIDSLYSGRISGSAATGVYAEYLSQVVNGTIAGGAPVVDVDVDATSASISGALGDEPSPYALPVFNWCREQDDPQPFVVGHPQFGVSFTWTANVFDEYPIPGTLDNLYRRVRADIGLYRPDVATIPPVERAATIVKFPTWLWINNPYDGIEASATSDTNQVRVEVRGRLERVEWHLGEFTLDCAPSEMTAYIEGEDPFDAPACHHIFTELDTFEFAATLHYVIEQRVTRRLYETQPWPTNPWIPHTTDPTVELTTDIGPYAVRELRAVNVSEEITG